MTRGVQICQVFVTPLKGLVAVVAFCVMVYFYKEHLLPLWRDMPQAVPRHRHLAVMGLIAYPALWSASWYALLFQYERTSSPVSPFSRQIYVVMGILGIVASLFLAYAVIAAER